MEPIPIHNKVVWLTLRQLTGAYIANIVDKVRDREV